MVEMEDKSVVADAASDSSEAPTYLYYTKDGPEPLGPSINSLVCAWIRFMNAGVYWDGTTKKWATKKPNSITTELLREVGYL